MTVRFCNAKDVELKFTISNYPGQDDLYIQSLDVINKIGSARVTVHSAACV